MTSLRDQFAAADAAMAVAGRALDDATAALTAAGPPPTPRGPVPPEESDAREGWDRQWAASCSQYEAQVVPLRDAVTAAAVAYTLAEADLRALAEAVVA